MKSKQPSFLELVKIVEGTCKRMRENMCDTCKSADCHCEPIVEAVDVSGIRSDIEALESKIKRANIDHDGKITKALRNVLFYVELTQDK